MGATGWKYFAPYQPDPEQALQELRGQVFASGDYCRPGELPASLRQVSGVLPWPLRLLLLGLRGYHATAATVRWLAGGSRRPRTIDEALELAGEDGTHSILDITHTSINCDFGAAVPLQEARLRALFGSTEPTHEQVVEAVELLWERMRRWEAIYFPVFVDGEAREWVFVGKSGD